MNAYDAIVVGAGPAGSAAAAALAGHGRRVLVLEKDRFPRAKVCGEFLSGSARSSLERLGTLDELQSGAERIHRGVVHLPGGRAVPFSLPAPGLGVSRFRLDDLLARRAADLGAEIRFGTRVLSVEGNLAEGFRVRHATSEGEAVALARTLVGAWGRWDSLDRALGRSFLGSRSKFFGWSRDFTGDAAGLEGEVRLYLFPGGYCGLSRVEGGAVNLAGVISERRRRRLGSGWDAVVAHARRACAALDRTLAALDDGPVGFLGTGPVFFTAKPPVEGGMLMVGDAAGVIDPFSGEGQSAALAAGLLAADTIERALAGKILMEGVAPLYAQAWKRALGRRFGWGAFFRRLMLSPTAGALAARLAGERVARFAVARLSSER